jgi:carbamoyltransferase
MPKKSVTVFSFSDGHDAGAALIRDGKVLAALQEERPKNIKHYDGTPELSMKEVFKIAGIHPSEVDLVAITNLVRVHAPSSRKPELSSRLPRESPINSKIWQALHMLGYIPFVSSHTFANMYVRILHNFREMKQINKILEELDLLSKETVFVEHHLAHASAAYRSCPWSYNEPTLVFTADGAGDGLSSTVSIAENGEIKRVASSPSYDSLGNAFYGAITVYLGLKPWQDEYKTMGLAPYGNPKRCISSMRRIIRLNPKMPLEFENRISPFIQSKLNMMLSGQRFDNIAAAAQQHLEDLLVNWIRKAIEKFDVHKIACSGGVFLNVKANKRIIEMDEVEGLFVYPASGDDGTAVGAGLQAYFKYCISKGLKPEKIPLTDLYYGPSFSDDQIERVLKETGWIKKAEYHKAIDSIVGEFVADGKIVARFNGRLEHGPRALGNRSILADARDLRTVGRINFAIKHRDFWMPFAPTIIENCMDEYLLNSKKAPYMILAFDTTDNRDEIIAGIHPSDKTCRPQTLNEAWNPEYREVLEAFQQKTSVGGLLNTSFNLHGYPIVCSPSQAIWTFENSQLDGLALGNYYLTK